MLYLRMRYIKLKSEQRQMLSRIRRQSRKPLVRDRAFCMLLSDQGQSIHQLTKFFDVHRNTIRNWFESFENDGLVGLYDCVGRGGKLKLQPHQQEAVIAWVRENPQSLDYIVHKVAQHFGLSVSRWTIKRFLKSQGLTWRRVRRGMPKQEDPIVVEKKHKN